MSDLTPCNYCTLVGIRARADREQKQVYLSPGLSGGVAVHILDPMEEGEKPITWKEKDENQLPSSNQVAWFMELTDRCAC